MIIVGNLIVKIVNPFFVLLFYVLMSGQSVSPIALAADQVVRFVCDICGIHGNRQRRQVVEGSFNG